MVSYFGEPNERIKDNSLKLKAYYKLFLDKMKKNSGVSCWHYSKYESLAMWKIYSIAKEGIAIKTTSKLLMESLEPRESNYKFIGGKVDYINYNENPISLDQLFSALMHKDICYKHETEFRLICYQVKNPNGKGMDPEDLCEIDADGHVLPLKYKRMIMEVVVSPYSASWFYNLVHQIVKDKYCLEIPIKKSEILIN